jgi:hypothetical protein
MASYEQLINAVYQALEQSPTLEGARAAIAKSHPEVPETVITEIVTGALGGDDLGEPAEPGTLRAKFWEELSQR